MQSFKEKSTVIIDTLVEHYDNISFRIRTTYSERAEHIASITKNVSYHYIPSYGSYLRMILDYLATRRKSLQDKQNISICDFGCGDGMLLSYIDSYLTSMYKNLDVRLHGIDIDHTIMPCTRNLVIRREDFLTTDPKFIAKHDLIYAYNPLREEIPSLELVDRIINNMKKGSTFLYLSAGTIKPGDLLERGFNHIEHTLYTFTKPL